VRKLFAIGLNEIWGAEWSHRVHLGAAVWQSVL